MNRQRTFEEEVLYQNGYPYPTLIKKFSAIELKYNLIRPKTSKLARDIVNKFKEEHAIYTRIVKRSQDAQDKCSGDKKEITF